MPLATATAQASPNIALIKYWGNVDHRLRLPASPSISFNLAELHTQTTVTWREDLSSDSVIINGQAVSGDGYDRVVHHLDCIRELAGHRGYAAVESANNFPTGAGIASSASAFAALSLAATAALGLQLDEAALSALARRGSGSASRSIPGGLVEWLCGATHEESYARTFAPTTHWPLIDLVAVVSRAHKKTVSSSGHKLADSSPLQQVRLATAQERFETCKAALLAKDYAALAAVVELDSTVMHSVMMTSTPPLYYWLPPTLTVMEAVRQWRDEAGLEVCFTIDAGPNVHCITTTESANAVETRLRALPGVEDVLRASMGGPARLLP